MPLTDLFLLPFAGGNAYSYQFLEPELSQRFAVHGLELPGRGRRIREPLLTDFAAGVQHYLQQIQRPPRGREFILYGHSMGALMAYQLARELEAIGTGPTKIVVSGSAGPLVRHNKNRHRMNEADFRASLRQLGGVPEELWREPALLNLFLPILRADFQAVELAGPMEVGPIHAPIVALMGQEEEHSAEIDAWKKLSHHVTTRCVPGGHFFIYQHRELLLQCLNPN